eukprot:223073-Hanusia_phi.AAC.3
MTDRTRTGTVELGIKPETAILNPTTQQKLPSAIPTPGTAILRLPAERRMAPGPDRIPSATAAQITEINSRIIKSGTRLRGHEGRRGGRPLAGSSITVERTRRVCDVQLQSRGH